MNVPNQYPGVRKLDTIHFSDRQNPQYCAISSLFDLITQDFRCPLKSLDSRKQKPFGISANSLCYSQTNGSLARKFGFQLEMRTFSMRKVNHRNDRRRCQIESSKYLRWFSFNSIISLISPYPIWRWNVSSWLITGIVKFFALPNVNVTVNGKEESYPLNDCRNVNTDTDPLATNDLAKLAHINDAAVLDFLKVRYMKNEIYVRQLRQELRIHCFIIHSHNILYTRIVFIHLANDLIDHFVASGWTTSLPLRFECTLCRLLFALSDSDVCSPTPCCSESILLHSWPLWNIKSKKIPTLQRYCWIPYWPSPSHIRCCTKSYIVVPSKEAKPVMYSERYGT